MNRLVRFAASSVLWACTAAVLATEKDALRAAVGTVIEPQSPVEDLVPVRDKIGLKWDDAELAERRASSGSLAGLSAEQKLQRVLGSTGLTANQSDALVAANMGAVLEEVKSATSSQDRSVAPILRKTPAVRATSRDNAVSNASQGKSESSPSEELQEVLVTGTHIRGVAESASPSLVLSRQAIQNSGALTIEDAFKKIPQNFSEVSQDGLFASGDALSSTNTRRVASISLRGLGANSTLVLLNGQRRPGAINGQAVDISAIPLTLIDRIEVVTGGRSAIYGSDAVAGVVNLITRKEIEGFESELYYGDSSHSGGSRVEASQVYGHQVDSGGFVVAYDYAHDQPLDVVKTGTVRGPSIAGQLPERIDIRPENKRHSAFLSGRYSVSDQVSFYGDGLYSYVKNKSENIRSIPEFGIDIAVFDDNISDQYSITGGAVVDLSKNWKLDISGNHGAVDMTSPQLLSIAGESFPSTEETLATITSATAIADGPLLQIGDDDVRIALGVEQRREQFKTLTRSTDRAISSIFAELHVPIFTDASRIGRLDMSLAERYDNYDDIGDSYKPQLGVTWTPIESTSVRAAYSEAFRAPDLFTLSTSPNGSLRLIENSATDTGTSAALLSGGGNRNLSPEEATNWSIGVDFRPGFAPQIRTSLSYFDIRYDQRIDRPSPTDTQLNSLLTNQQVQNELAPLLNLQPSEIQLQSILASYDTSLVNETGTAFDPASQNLRTVFPGVITLDLRYNNISVERVRGLDVQIDSELETQLGLLSGGFNGSYVLQHERRITETSSWASLLNIPGRPVDFRFRANAGLARGAYSGFIYLNYTDHYEDRFSDPVVKIKSWTTVDMTFRFSGKDAGRLRPVGDLSAAISVTNVFDKAPPAYFNTFVGLGYDPTNADPIGRTMSVRLVKQW